MRRGRRGITDALDFVNGFTPEGALNLPAAVGCHPGSIDLSSNAVVLSDFLMDAEEYQPSPGWQATRQAIRVSGTMILCSFFLLVLEWLINPRVRGLR